jgi:hypothetical protein
MRDDIPRSAARRKMRREMQHEQVGKPAPHAVFPELFVGVVETVRKNARRESCTRRRNSYSVQPPGGVSIHPHLALEAERLKADNDGKLNARRETIGARLPPDRWWWD